MANNLTVSTFLLLALSPFVSYAAVHPQLVAFKTFSFPKGTSPSSENGKNLQFFKAADSPAATEVPSQGNNLVNSGLTSTVCKSSEGKEFTFTNQDCLNAARVIANESTSSAQCGNCVIGLFDVNKKKAFTPPGPVSPSVLENQVNKVLSECSNRASSTNPPVNNKRSLLPSQSGVESVSGSDSIANHPAVANAGGHNNLATQPGTTSPGGSQPGSGSGNSDSATVQMVMGYNPTSKAC
ncbi:hypothetical protein BY996DRAFT_6415158 [Phakopsora pachyrhizi]|uniref:Expressed protein n=1 Tax=Phakopsora pachyrhizi TaxID=170000 RepID=A0AAV0AHM3_PHAPC|nr:hypothetical protein BY996DRAFT_6415158 [Phakopsora pachyrhizi]CAH7666814.1 expressed protein [Phakopsora pachyrhizi]